MSDKLNEVIYYLISKLGYVESRSKLIKLLFLADIEAKEKLKRTITDIEYIYHYYGPYSEKIIEKLNEMNEEYIKEVYNPFLDRYEYYVLKERKVELDNDEIKILDEIINKYGKLKTNHIKEIAYNTKQVLKTKPGDIIKI